VIAVDTNILVYAHRTDAEWHAPAQLCVRKLAQGRAAWAIPWPCIHEFFAITTHPRIYAPPSTTQQAVNQVDAWMESPTLTLLGEATQHWRILRGQLLDSRVSGPLVHDARVAAICIAHGVRELLTADRDFARFPGLSCRNPLIAAP
jgi:toxin-antitoxin system PIN domain toxin